ncbi:MAG: MoaD/ThiS family protein [Nitrospirae bacterium]|nr:MAG: MoaD/ThiS family protein [Nitrospirota bacterium]
MTVHIPSPLRSYTAQQAEVAIAGSTLAEVLGTLDRQFPGFRFRIITEQDTIRQHIRIFVNEEQAPNLTVPLRPDDQVYIICALSGG